MVIKEVSACENFKHVKDHKTLGHFHGCLHDNNESDSCGYSLDNWRLCPIAGMPVIMKIDFKEP